MLKDQKKHLAAHLGRAAEQLDKCLKPLPDKSSQCGTSKVKTDFSCARKARSQLSVSVKIRWHLDFE